MKQSLKEQMIPKREKDGRCCYESTIGLEKERDPECVRNMNAGINVYLWEVTTFWEIVCECKYTYLMRR